MVINWYGEGCFKIQTGGLTILTDPFDASTGLTPPRFKADVTIKTLTSLPIESTFGAALTEEVTVHGPGEYEIKGVEIKGWPLEEKRSSEATLKTYYIVGVENMRLAFLGHMSEGEASLLENLGTVDILFLPAGGAPYLDPEVASSLIKQLNPKMVITSFFKVSGLKRKAHEVKEFLKEIGEEAETQEKLTIKKSDLPERMRAVVLQN